MFGHNLPPALVRHIVLVLVVPTSLRTARIAHSTKSYVGQAVLVLDSVRTEQWSVGVSECWSVGVLERCAKQGLHPACAGLKMLSGQTVLDDYQAPLAESLGRFGTIRELHRGKSSPNRSESHCIACRRSREPLV
jgi:hypothetical protein